MISGLYSLQKDIQNNTKLTHLNLKQNGIGTKGAEGLIKNLKGPRDSYLVALNLSNNNINELLAVKLIEVINSFDKPGFHT